MFGEQVVQNASGAKIMVDKDEFIRLVKSSKSTTVVHVPAKWYTMGNTYMLSHGGLYVIAKTKEELAIPKHIEVIRSTGIFGLVG